jgi:catalase
LNISFTSIRTATVGTLLLAIVLITALEVKGQNTSNDLAQQIFETMVQIQGKVSGFRLVHAKGIVCEGSFTPSKAAANISRAAHFQGASSPVIIRFSNGSPNPAVMDNSPDAGPRGMAIRFQLPGGEQTDIVAISHNGFVVGTGEEFLALQRAVAATDPRKPHPWPIEEFMASHPLALKFVLENQVIPASFASESFFSNDSFIFVNKKGVKQAVRYQIIPLAGRQVLNDAEAKTKSADFLMQELRARLAKEPIKFRLVAQLPNDGDPTNDPSLVWPEDRKTIDVGVISVTSVVADSTAAERALAFDPINLTDGIELSDDPLPALRSKVYALSVAHRRQK